MRVRRVQEGAAFVEAAGDSSSATKSSMAYTRCCASDVDVDEPHYAEQGFPTTYRRLPRRGERLHPRTDAGFALVVYRRGQLGLFKQMPRRTVEGRHARTTVISRAVPQPVQSSA